VLKAAGSSQLALLRNVTLLQIDDDGEEQESSGSDSPGRRGTVSVWFAPHLVDARMKRHEKKRTKTPTALTST
jgi:hypothetical protein